MMDDQYLAVFIAVLNAIVAFIRFIYCVQARRMITVVWFLVAYFSVFFVVLAIEGPFFHTQGFTLETIKIDDEVLYATCLFAFEFNLIFLISEVALWRIFGSKKSVLIWDLPEKSRVFDKLCFALGTLLVIGSIWYWYTTREHNYRAYVEFKGSNWGSVFLWASSPVISIFALRGKLLIALVASIPFVFFAFHLNVRSFALLSVIPILIIESIRASTVVDKSFLKRFGSIVIVGILGSALLLISSMIMQDKLHGKNTRTPFPDADLPGGTAIIFRASDLYRERTSFDSLELYIENFLNPFLRLLEKSSLKEQRPEVTDPPVVMAQLIEGVPSNWNVYFHYPALWYSDSYLAFGNLGLAYAAFWALVCTIFEYLMTRNQVWLSLLLPFYCWHSYMLVRGAVAGASNPFMYAAYIAFIFAMIVLGPKAFRFSDRGNVGSPMKTK